MKFVSLYIKNGTAVQNTYILVIRHVYSFKNGLQTSLENAH